MPARRLKSQLFEIVGAPYGKEITIMFQPVSQLDGI